MRRFLLTVFLLAVTATAALGGESPWTLRFHGALVEASGRHEGFTTGSTGSRIDLDAGGGLGVAVEYRFSKRVGLEFSALLAGLTLSTSYVTRSSTGIDSSELSMVPLTLGLPFHLASGGRVDVLLGPTLSYVRYQETESSITFQSSRMTIDAGSDIAMGAVLGLDTAFGDGGWAFSAGLRYVKTAAGGIDVDPLIVTMGFAYRF